MKKPISISFAPNYQRDDVLLSCKLLAKLLAGQADKTSTSRVKKILQEIFGVKDVNSISLFSSARAGLYYALRSFGLQKNDEVLIQAFTCVAVPCAVKWAHLKPVFVDVDKNTYNFDVADMKKKTTNRTRAIIVQHTFGIPGPLDEIKKFANENGLLIIEDCAHVIGATHNNKVLGMWGDIGVFSFGRDKALSSVFGGAVIVNNQKFTHAMQTFEIALTPARVNFVAQQLLYPVIYTLSLWSYNLGFGKALLWFSARIGLLSKAVYKQEKEGLKPHFLEYSFHPSLAALLLNQLNKLELYNNHRRLISNEYIKEINLKLALNQPYLRIPLYVRQKAQFLRKAQGVGIHLGNWYRAPIDPPGSDVEFFNYNSCPVAKDLADHTINLPTHVNISSEDARKIILLCKTES